jgi:hypothetical protein
VTNDDPEIRFVSVLAVPYSDQSEGLTLDRRVIERSEDTVISTLGYQPGTTHYRVLDITKTKTIDPRDVKFSREEVDVAPSAPSKPIPTPTVSPQSQWEYASDAEESEESEDQEEGPTLPTPERVKLPDDNIVNLCCPRYPGWVYEEEPLSTDHQHLVRDPRMLM